MPKLKNNLILCGALLVIITCVSGAVLEIIDLAVWWFYNPYGGIYRLLIIPLCIFGIVLGIRMCVKYNNPSKTLIFVAIGTIGVGIFLTIFFAAVGNVQVWEALYYEIPLAIAAAGFFTAGLVVNNPDAVSPQNEKPQTSIEKVEMLRKLRDDGQITEEEYKEMLMKELAK